MTLPEIIDKSAGKGNEVSELTRKILSNQLFYHRMELMQTWYC